MKTRREPYTISEGTLRTCDLLPKFLEEAADLANALEAEELRAQRAKLPARTDDPWWDSEDADFAMEEVQDRLCDLAPEGLYFGPHEGDGACFGFWASEYDDSSSGSGPTDDGLGDAARGEDESARDARITRRADTFND